MVGLFLMSLSPSLAAGEEGAARPLEGDAVSVVLPAAELLSDEQLEDVQGEWGWVLFSAATNAAYNYATCSGCDSEERLAAAAMGALLGATGAFRVTAVNKWAGDAVGRAFKVGWNLYNRALFGTVNRASMNQIQQDSER